MKRREFITLIGAVAACPRAIRAQPVPPVIGFLHAGSPEPNTKHAAAFRTGLSERDYIEGRNVTIEYRWAEGQDERLPALATDLVRHKAAVIATPGTTQAALAAKAATTTIPIVFSTGADPVALGLVASLSRPGGNATGIVNISANLAAKRLGLLRNLVPRATRFAVLVTHKGPLTKGTLKELQIEAPQLRLPVKTLYADSADEIDVALAELAEKPGTALMVSPDALFTDLRAQIVALAAQHAVPAIYPVREFAEAGGLMSYGPNFMSTYRQVGEYSGRILQGAKPSELPVVQATKFELVINLKAAKALGLDAPDTLLALADDVIE
jgi:putative ABC transport system substrate-binding protein